MDNLASAQIRVLVPAAHLHRPKSAVRFAEYADMTSQDMEYLHGHLLKIVDAGYPDHFHGAYYI